MSLELKNVEKKVGIETHIYPTNIKLEKNTINVLLGSTLAGKTTLMQIMAGSENGGAENFFVRLSSALSDFNINQKIITRPNNYRVPKLRSSKLSVTEARFGGFFDFHTALLYQHLI